MPKGNRADIGFERQLWDAACILRGNMDAAEYKHVVLGLIFLKFVSDAFLRKHKALKSRGDGTEESAAAYAAAHVFYVPPSARWGNIAGRVGSEDIGRAIDDAMRSIEQENPTLHGVLPKNFARPELDKRRLGEVVRLFSGISAADHGRSKDILGRTYEYCLARFAEQEGKRGGEFYTPASVVDTLVAVMKPYQGVIYDPCCGSGGMFVQSAKFVELKRGNVDNLSVFGQDANPTTWKLSRMNLAIRGIEANLGAMAADTFFQDLHPGVLARYIMANPPFNLSDWGAEHLGDDARWVYGVPPAGNANFAWMQHMLWHLQDGGRMGIVLANGSLTSQSGGEAQIRRAIIEQDLVEGIVAMPGQLFYTTQIPCALWFLRKGKPRPGKTLFLDARQRGTMISRRLRQMDEDDIDIIAGAFTDFEQGRLRADKGFSAEASIRDIADQDYVLTPGRYVGLADLGESPEAYEEKMRRLTGELSALMAQSDSLDEELRRRLGDMGFPLR